MGKWGIGTDECDEAYDEMGIDMIQCDNLKFTEKGKRIIWIDEYKDSCIQFKILCLKLGIFIPKEILDNMIIELSELMKNNHEISDAIKFEIYLCKRALREGNIEPPEPVFGIISTIYRQGDYYTKRLDFLSKK